MKKFKMSIDLNDSDLYNLFAKKSRYIQAGNFYYIYFNGKDISADNPSDLLQKMKDEYEIYRNLNKYYENGIG